MPVQLKIATEKCTGCRACELACSLENEDIVAVFGSRIRVISFNESSALGLSCNLPLTCHQCLDAPCLNVCPEQALIRITQTPPLVKLDQGKCTSCGLCIKACPFGAIRWVKKLGKIIKCELCGGSPACADICPTGAITFGEENPFIAREKAFYMKGVQILKTGKKNNTLR